MNIDLYIGPPYYQLRYWINDPNKEPLRSTTKTRVVINDPVSYRRQRPPENQRAQRRKHKQQSIQRSIHNTRSNGADEADGEHEKWGCHMCAEVANDVSQRLADVLATVHKDPYCQVIPAIPRGKVNIICVRNIRPRVIVALWASHSMFQPWRE